MRRILIFDTTLRDGEQSPGATMTTAEKVRMGHQLEQLGVDVVEAGFPISSPGDFEAVQRVAREIRTPVIAALARCHDQDIDRAAAALESAARARLHVFIATSDVHLRRKLGITRDECLERTARAVKRARRLVDDIEFSAEDATRTDLGFLTRVVQTALEAGATTINIPDTVGYTYPSEYRRIIEALFASVNGLHDVVVSVHCHNDLGLAVANSLAAIEAGARQVECTVNGIGERAGNTSLEEVVMALKVRQDLLPYDTGIKTTEIFRSSGLLAALTGIHPQPNKAVVGKNAFAHEAGIHQAGMIKDRTTYEIMTPEMVGVPESRLVLGKHSGRHALVKRYRELGYELDEHDLARVYAMVVELADQKKTVLDEDLLAILQHGAMNGDPDIFEIVELRVACGRRRSQATVRLTESGSPAGEATADGDGPLAAAFAAIDKVVGLRVKLEDLTIRAATPGREALGEVSLHAQVEGKTFTGRGVSTDVVEAAARAYIHVLNKAVRLGAVEASASEDVHYLWGV